MGAHGGAYRNKPEGWGGACKALRKPEKNLTGPRRLEAETRDKLTGNAKSPFEVKMSRLHSYKYLQDTRGFIRCHFITGSSTDTPTGGHVQIRNISDIPKNAHSRHLQKP